MNYLDAYDLSKYIDSDLAKSVDSILNTYSLNICNSHVKRVASFIVNLAKEFGIDEEKAEIAALLHDVGGIVPCNERIDYCDHYGITLCKEEKELPLIIHQKISKHIAQTQFGIVDEEILTAISCHTTMKEDASTLDMLMFISDKIEWDQKGEPPYKDMVIETLKDSLELSVYKYMRYNLDNKLLETIHPDYLKATKWLEDILYTHNTEA